MFKIKGGGLLILYGFRYRKISDVLKNKGGLLLGGLALCGSEVLALCGPEVLVLGIGLIAIVVCRM